MNEISSELSSGFNSDRHCYKSFILYNHALFLFIMIEVTRLHLNKVRFCDIPILSYNEPFFEKIDRNGLSFISVVALDKHKPKLNSPDFYCSPNAYYIEIRRPVLGMKHSDRHDLLIFSFILRICAKNVRS
jgi:hypothetical protein